MEQPSSTVATVISSRLIELDYCRLPCPPAKNMNLSRIVERGKGMERAAGLEIYTRKRTISPVNWQRTWRRLKIQKDRRTFEREE